MADSKSLDGQMLAEAIGLEDAGEALEMVRGLLDSGVSPNAVGWDGEPPLEAAVRIGMGIQEFDLVRLLIERGGQCDWAGELCNLLCHGPRDVFEVFLSRSGGWASLIEATPDEPRVEINPVTELIGMGKYETLESHWTDGLEVLLNIPVYDLGRTPLMQAADDGDLYAAQWLLDKGADVNAYFEFCDSYTALDLAVSNLDVEMARWLLGAGANPNVLHGYSLPLEDITSVVRAANKSSEDWQKAIQIREMMLPKASQFPRPHDHRGTPIEPWPPKL